MRRTTGRARAGTVLPGLLLLLAACWWALPGGVVRDATIAAVNALVVVALAVGLHRLRPEPRRLWQALLAGQVLNTVAWTSWMVLPLVQGVPLTTPNLGDPLFLSAYLLLAVVLAGLSRAAGATRGHLLDAAVVGLCAAVLIWTTVASPQAPAPGLTPVARAVALAYPMLDVLLLTAVAPLVLAAGRSPRAQLLGGWVVLQLSGDLLYGWLVVTGRFTTSTPVYALYVCGYALLAAAALHPSGLRPVRAVRWWRTAVLVVGVLPLPGLLVLRVAQGSDRHVALIAVATVVVTGLAVLRSGTDEAGLPDQVRRAVRRSLVRWAAGLVLLGLLPLGTVTLLAVSEARRSAEVEVAQQLSAAASTTALHVQEQTGALAGLVASYADRDVVRDAAAGSAPDSPALREQLGDLLGRSPAYRGAWFLDADGRVRASASGGLAEVSWSPAWVSQVLSGRSAVVGDLLQSGVGPGRLLAVAAPVHVDGRPAGLVLLGTRLDAFERYVSRVAGHARASLTLTDGAGNVLAGPVRTGDAGRVGVQHALAGRAGLLREDVEPDTWTAYEPVPQVGWAVVAEVPTQQVHAPARLLTGRLVAAATLLAQGVLAALLLQLHQDRRRRAAEAQLAAREQQVREVLDAAGDAFISVDGRGRVLRWNRRAQEVLGWTAAQAEGRSLPDLLLPEQGRAEQLRGLSVAAKAAVGRSAVLEVTLRRADGTSFPGEVTLWSTRDGETAVHNGFLRDLTVRKEHEAQLAQARDAALRASRLKSEFVANMSHEIRTPLNGVVGMTTLLRDTPLDDRQAHFVDTLRLSADALLSVIDDVLDFSKIEAGKLDVEQVDVEVRPLVEDVAELLGATASLKGLTLVAEVDPGLPEVLRTDGHRLRQVLTNLVSNAIKFTQSGSVVVRAHRDGADDEHGLVPLRIDVTDTGCGIPVSLHQVLFEPFTQADASMTRRHGGTGLGLTISRQLVALLGGRLTLDSEPGRGSTFSVHLRLSVGDCTEPRPDLPRPGTVPLPRDGAATRRALVAEDSAVNQLVVVEMLALLGWEADVVGDGAQCLAQLQERTYDLVLMDCQMPVMDGYAATAQIRRLPGPQAAVRIVALTASALEGDREDCRRAGMDGFLAKPLRIEELGRVLGGLAAEPAGTRT